MNITVFGTGYVGLVTGACLADVGHSVLCMDVDQNKIAELREGIIPIHEPGLDAVVKRCIGEQTLRFTTSAASASVLTKLQSGRASGSRQ